MREERRGGGREEERREGEKGREEVEGDRETSSLFAQSNLCLTNGMFIRSTASRCRGSTDSFHYL